MTSTAPLPSSDPLARRALRAGATDIAPIVLSVVPFGLVAGVAAVEAGLGLSGAVGLSLGVFAGASQLAAIDILGAGGPVVVAIATALVINLRFVLYSASLSPHLGGEPFGRRALAAYLLTDQAYAMSTATFAADRAGPAERFWYYLGCATPLWVTWQITTVVGAVAGSAVPDDVPLDFAVPLAFLVLLLPNITDRSTVVAAVTAAVVATAAAGLPARLGMPVAAVAGVGAGWLHAHASGASRASDPPRPPRPS